MYERDACAARDLFCAAELMQCSNIACEPVPRQTFCDGKRFSRGQARYIYQNQTTRALRAARPSLTRAIWFWFTLCQQASSSTNLEERNSVTERRRQKIKTPGVRLRVFIFNFRRVWFNKPGNTEGWQSGLTRRTRNAVGEKSPRRFESSTLRKISTA